MIHMRLIHLLTVIEIIMKQLFILFIMFSFSSVSGQKTMPTTVTYSAENNTTAISFKREKDFVLPGKWEKHNETIDHTKFYLTDSDSNKIGVRKFVQKKMDFYEKNMEPQAFYTKFIEATEVTFSKEEREYDFTVLDETKNVDYKYYIIESKSKTGTNNYKTINLVGVKNGIVYDLSIYVYDGNESEMKSLVLQLYNSN